MRIGKLKWVAVLATVATLATAKITVKNDFEVEPPGEEALNNALAEGAAKGLGKEEHRDAHAWAHGCFEDATFEVKRDLDKLYRVGVFSVPGRTYPMVGRFSNGAGEVDSDDRKGGGQGLAIKFLLDPKLVAADKQTVYALKGEKMFKSVDKKYYYAQDFLGINRVKEFFVNVPEHYPAFSKAKAAAGAVVAKFLAEKKQKGETPTPVELAQVAKEASGAFAKIYPIKENNPGAENEARVLAELTANKTLNPLFEEYNSMVPSLFGEDGKRAVKYLMAPCTPVDPDKYDFPKTIDPKTDPKYLSKVLAHELGKGEACYKLLVQFWEKGMPSVESAAFPWLPAKYVELGTFKFSKLTSKKFCENLTFTPWHTLLAHLPAGGIQRARQKIYVAVANARHKNGKQQERK